ncbi:MAG: hypothetical protein F4Y63_04895 [Chloroflexi bacterium]|nr:hypothetical protein [Chloroflexota bacterium]MYK60982.1 hypothetical protein [Chloroflexota bacterium]
MRKGTLLEQALPFRELSLVAEASRRSRDPAYSVHRWWARRPPLVMRGLLLAASLPGDVDAETYWRLFESSQPALNGLHVHDPFAGGGSTLVEAARLGASVSGTDVDPLAVEIIKHEIEPVDQHAFSRAANLLLQFLRRKLGHLFFDPDAEWTPVHYFYLHEVICPGCGQGGTLYKDLVLARRSSKGGSVVRKWAITAFCPNCFGIHGLEQSDRSQLHCCGKRYPLYSGTYTRKGYSCPHCGHRSNHAELQSGNAPRRLLAIEETRDGSPRRIRQPDPIDVELLDDARRYLIKHKHEIDIPKYEFERDRVDARPVSYGVQHLRELFTDRQIALFGHAFRWLEENLDADIRVNQALRLALSNALATNNRLCSYARDYGRLAPLFSLRGYALPAMPVELNPFHVSAGRGTLKRNFDRVQRSSTKVIQRHCWDTTSGEVRSFVADYSTGVQEVDVLCAPAHAIDRTLPRPQDICIFDPPYFDNIAYSELSEFYRGWWTNNELGGTPLAPNGHDPIGSFGHALAKEVKPMVEALNPDCPLAFSYHSATRDAWEAIGVALDDLQLLVTALWPVKTDSHMGLHAADGNCEWDIIVVCRKRSVCENTELTIASADEWIERLHPLFVRGSDRTSMNLAIRMASERFGVPNTLEKI